MVFDFRLDRSRDGPRQFLAGFEGILQTDGYAAYQGVGRPQVVEAACWAHVRRKFFEAARLNAEDPAPARVVARIDELFGLEAEARARGWQGEARREWRRRHAPPRLEALRAELEAVSQKALPASALGRAAAYALSLCPSCCGLWIMASWS